jgi:hypothetical protein
VLLRFPIVEKTDNSVGHLLEVEALQKIVDYTHLFGCQKKEKAKRILALPLDELEGFLQEIAFHKDRIGDRRGQHDPVADLFGNDNVLLTTQSLSPHSLSNPLLYSNS